MSANRKLAHSFSLRSTQSGDFTLPQFAFRINRRRLKAKHATMMIVKMNNLMMLMPAVAFAVYGGSVEAGKGGHVVSLSEASRSLLRALTALSLSRCCEL